jgi:hypothetical protein
MRLLASLGLLLAVLLMLWPSVVAAASSSAAPAEVTPGTVFTITAGRCENSG